MTHHQTAVLLVVGLILLVPLNFTNGADDSLSSEQAITVSTADELQKAFHKRRTVVLQPGKRYSIKPPLIVNGILVCQGATIEAASDSSQKAGDPTSALIESSDSVIINGTLDCKGLVNSGVFSRGKLKVIGLTIVDYRRKGLHCVHGKDGKPVDSITIDGLSVRSRKLDPSRTGPAFQYDSSKPCKLVILNDVTVAAHNDIGKPTTVFKVAHVQRLFADNIDAGGSKIVFGENVGEAFIRVKNLHYEKGGRGIDYHPDPSWTGPSRPRRLTIIEEPR